MSKIILTRRQILRSTFLRGQKLIFQYWHRREFSFFFLYRKGVRLSCYHFFAIVLESVRTASLRWNKFLITNVIRARVWLNRRPLVATIAGCILHPHLRTKITFKFGGKGTLCRSREFSFYSGTIKQIQSADAARTVILSTAYVLS